MRIRQHIPASIPMDMWPLVAEFDSMETLEAIPFVGQFKKLNGFKRYSYSEVDGAVMAEVDGVNRHHVVGYVDLEPGFLPQFIEDVEDGGQ